MKAGLLFSKVLKRHMGGFVRTSCWMHKCDKRTDRHGKIYCNRWRRWCLVGSLSKTRPTKPETSKLPHYTNL